MSIEKPSAARSDQGSKGPQTLEDLVLTQDEIADNELSKDQILMIKLGGQAIGPISKGDLKHALQEEIIFLPTNTIFKSSDTNGWIPIFEYPLFQRRKPAIVSFQSVGESDRIQLLKHGQHTKEYTKQQIIESIQSKKILLTDQISLDGGESWCKIHQVDDFDRRMLTTSTLPESTPSDILLYANTYDPNKRERIDQQHALPALHYIGQVASGGGKKQAFPTPLNIPDRGTDSKQLTSDEDVSEQNTRSSGLESQDSMAIATHEDESYTPEYQSQKLKKTLRSKKIKIALGVVTILVAALLYQLWRDGPSSWQREWNGKSLATPTRSTPDQQVSKNKKVKKAAKAKNATRSTASIRRQEREQAREERIARSISKRRERLRQNKEKAKRRRVQASERRKRSLANQVAATEEQDIDNENFDDGSTPVEQDEIRSRLSKDTIDPEDHEFEDSLDNDEAETISDNADDLNSENNVGEEYEEDEVL
jgi:hypothetical protein